MTTTDLLLKLKYHFRDYFIPVEGKTVSLVGLEDMITEFEESKFIMKIDFKLTKDKLISLNQVLSVYDQLDFRKVATCNKSSFSMRKELRNIFVIKTIRCSESKPFKVSLPYYLANELFIVLVEYCTENKSSYINGLDQLKNIIHQKLI